MASCDGERLVLQLHAGGAGFAESGADDHRGPATALPALTEPVGTSLPGRPRPRGRSPSGRSSGEATVGTPRTSRRCGLTAYTAPVKPDARMLRRTSWPTVPGAVPGADDHDRARREQRAQARRLRRSLPVLDRGDGGRDRVDRDLDVQRPAVHRRGDREAEPPDDLDHACVLAEHLADEAADAHAAGQRDEMLEQQGADAVVL